jgi:transposase
MSSWPIPRRQAIAEKGAIAVIPNNPSRARKHPLECGFSTRKPLRRVAPRYEKTARNSLAVITLAATILWLG